MKQLAFGTKGKGERFQHTSSHSACQRTRYGNRSSRPELNGTVTKVYNARRTGSAMELSFDQNQLADKEKENGSHREQAADAANF